MQNAMSNWELKLFFLNSVFHIVSMDVLNKFRSTVTSTMSQLSTVLPGNPVTREYEATKHIASAGVGMFYFF
jgi:hypothetical protein